MPRLSKDEARELAAQFNSLADTLMNYRLDNFGELTSARRAELRQLETRFRDFSNDFTDLAINLTLEDVESDLKAIGEATKKAKGAIKSLQKVRDVVKVATAAFKLGAAVITGNAQAIASAVQGVASAIKQ